MEKIPLERNNGVRFQIEICEIKIFTVEEPVFFEEIDRRFFESFTADTCCFEVLRTLMDVSTDSFLLILFIFFFARSDDGILSEIGVLSVSGIGSYTQERFLIRFYIIYMYNSKLENAINH